MDQKILISKLHYSKNSGLFIYRNDDRSRHVQEGDVAGWVWEHRDGNNYIYVSVMGKQYFAHRLAFLYVTGEIPSMVDHRDGDGTNNRWINLRPTTHSANQRNRKVAANSKSGVTGVYYRRSLGKWCAHIKVHGKKYYLGAFEDKQDAIDARRVAEDKFDFDRR